MKIKFCNPLAALVVLAFGVFPLFSTAFGQGALTPSGAPAPTMKTLAQIEPRMPISTLPYTIGTAGSYYLTTNLTGQAGANGITISTANVTLDLNGFAIIGVAGSLNGISVGGNNVALHNGTVCNWGGAGVYSENADSSQFEELRVSQNGSYGLYVGVFSSVARCQVQNNGNHGIFIGTGGLVTGCTSSGNTNSGIVNYSFNSETPNVLVTGCNVYGNKGSGIVGTESSVGNVCTGNAASGIFLWGYGGRAERNQVLRNGSGIDLSSSSSTNVVVGNFVIGNTNGAISVAGSGNIVGPLITTTGTVTNNNPWANFTF